MDQELFFHLCEEYAAREKTSGGIGTLSEKTIHAVLKDYMDSNPLHQEQPFCGYVADIYDGSAVVEIQTRGFDRLRRKLTPFLKEVPVTIVHPIPDTKWLVVADRETGEILSRRKSPLHGSIYSAVTELYKIKPYLKDPNLHLHFIFLDVEEYRLSDVRKKGRGKKSVRQERIPLSLNYEITIDTPDDYRKLLPDGLPAEFTSKDYAKAAHIPLSRAQTALNILTYMETVSRTGKKGNLIIYRDTAGP